MRWCRTAKLLAAAQLNRYGENMKFDIWIEGYKATGYSGNAQKVASGVEADNFRDAVLRFSKTDAAKGYGEFKETSLSFWMCRCFETEDEARKSFG